MSIANQKASLEYQEAVQATEEVESPALGFTRPSDFRGGVSSLNSAIIKQNNTLLYLLVKQSQRLLEFEEKLDKIKREVETITKLPPILSKRIEESFRSKYPGLTAGVLPAISFTYSFISDMCKEAALQKELRDLSLCSAIPIPGYYEGPRKKYGLRKSK